MCRNHPPHPGAIYWARLLFYRLKRPTLKLQEVQEIRTSSLKLEAFSNYLKVAKAIKKYEQQKYEQWLAEVTPIIEKTMKMNIVKVHCKGMKPPKGKTLR